MLKQLNFHRWLGIAAAMAGLALAPLASAADGKFRARGIIRSGVDKNGHVHGDFAKVTGLKNASSLSYKLLVLGDDGTEKFVDEEDFKFKIGQKFRLQIETDTDLYVYVFHEGPDNARTVLMPDKHDDGRVPLSKRGQKMILPDDGTYFEFVPPPGTEQLLVYASPELRKELTPTEAFEDEGDKATRLRLKSAQDKVFSQASQGKTVEADTLDQLAQTNVKDFRQRGLVWKPKANNEDGKTVFSGTFNEEKKPEVFVTISLKSNR